MPFPTINVIPDNQFYNSYLALSYQFIMFDLLLSRWLKKLLKSCCKKKSSTIDPDRPVEGGNPGVNSEKSKFLINEKNKPVLKEFTLNEYMEKVLQYGFIVVRRIIKIYLKVVMSFFIYIVIISYTIYLAKNITRSLSAKSHDRL